MHTYQNGGGGCLSVMGIANRHRSDLAFVFVIERLKCRNQTLNLIRAEVKGGSELPGAKNEQKVERLNTG